jgi:hypothetical protein
MTLGVDPCRAISLMPLDRHPLYTLYMKKPRKIRGCSEI